MVNTAGGIAGGDRIAVAIDSCGGRVASTVTTPAAEKIYRVRRSRSRDVRRDCCRSTRRALDWLPQETILFDRARLARRLDVELAEDASSQLCRGDGLRPRTRMGETHDPDGLFARSLAHPARRRRLIFADDCQARRRHRRDCCDGPASPTARARATFLHVAPMPRRASKPCAPSLDERRRRGGVERLERHAGRALLRPARSTACASPRTRSSWRSRAAAAAARLAKLEGSNHESDAARKGQAADRHGGHRGAPAARARRQAQPSGGDRADHRLRRRGRARRPHGRRADGGRRACPHRRRRSWTASPR